MILTFLYYLHMKQNSLFIFLSVFLFFSQSCQSQAADLKSIPAVEFKAMIEKGSVILIDVRSSSEYQEGHISGAKNLDVNSSDFVLNVQKIGKKKPLALYCRSGRRSKLAASKLAALKIVIYDLNYGINEWLQASYPVVKK